MRTHKNKSFAALALATALVTHFTAPQAHALPGLDIGLMAGGAISKSSANSVDGGFGLSFGPTVGMGPIEASALYSQYKLTAPTVSTSTNYLEIPVLYRLGLGPVSVGVGGFYSVFLSGSTTVGSTTTDLTSGSSNYGATASARVTIPMLGLFADARYNLGLRDSSGSKLSSLGFYLGWNFL
ncbi:MAG: outer membrane beta-barrel protein [Oligoflexia bacterium]